MGRKNRRAKIERRDSLRFDPNKYIKQSGRSRLSHSSSNYRGNSQTSTEHPYRIPYRGEVWFAELGFHPGTSVQDGCRPVLIISNDKGNHYASTIVVLPMTTSMKKSGLPSHVEVRKEDLSQINPNQLLDESMLLAEQITTIAKSALRNYVGKIGTEEKLKEIDSAVKAQLGLVDL